MAFVPDTNIINDNGYLQTRSAVTFVTEDDAIPDPKVTMLGQFIAVRPISISSKIESKTGSGFSLIMPDTAKEHAQQLLAVGRVVGVGDKACIRANVSKVEVGDYIIFPKHSGDFFKIGGVKLVAMYDDVPIAKVDPDQLDLTI